MFVHKNSNNKVSVPASTILDELPYTSIDFFAFERMGSDYVEFAREESLKKGMPKTAKMINVKTYQCVEGNCIALIRDVSWAELKDVILQYVRTQDFKDPGTIYDVALSDSPIFRPGRTKVVDDRAGFPYDAFPDNSIIYICMFKRSEGWKPLVVGISVCNACGNQESSILKLSVCSRCKSTKYCSKECQQIDWKKHKQACK